MKKLSTIKFYNFSRSTTLVLVISPSEVIEEFEFQTWEIQL
jgi:hypothetical protein